MANTIHHRVGYRQKKYGSSHGSQERSVLTVTVRGSIRVHETDGLSKITHKRYIMRMNGEREGK